MTARDGHGYEPGEATLAARDLIEHVGEFVIAQCADGSSAFGVLKSVHLDQRHMVEADPSWRLHLVFDGGVSYTPGRGKELTLITHRSDSERPAPDTYHADLQRAIDRANRIVASAAVRDQIEAEPQRWLTLFWDDEALGFEQYVDGHYGEHSLFRLVVGAYLAHSASTYE